MFQKFQFNDPASRRLLLALGPILLVWALFFQRASFFWGGEGYYFFGWLVPPLGVLFLWQKLRSLPVPSEGDHAVVFWMTQSLLLPFLLLYGFHATMPFWRPLVFGMGLIALLYSLGTVWSWGGRRWSLHFLSVFLILLICLPWPSSWEGVIVHRLTMAVTHVTEFSLNLLGYAATSEGNRIDLHGQSVEVGDACSGIRSFQGLFMVGVVIGELYRFGWNRVTLMIAAFLISFPLNILRALTLSIVVVSQGQEGYEAWHDPLGGVVYLVGCVALLGVGQFFQWLQKPERPPRRSPKPLTVPATWRPATAIALFIGLFAVGLEWHFRAHSKTFENPVVWESHPEKHPEQVRARSLFLDAIVYDTLQFDDGHRFELYSEGGDRFEFYDFRYDSGMMGILAAEHHTPEVCIGKYGGGHLTNRDAALDLRVGDLDVPVFGFTFEYPNGRRLHAFQGVWISGEDEQSAAERHASLVVRQGARTERLKVAWQRLVRGQRDFPVQVFLLILPSQISLDEAWIRAETMLELVLSPLDTAAALEKTAP